MSRKISGKKVKNGELFEYLGDLFYYGIKYPHELMILKMLYGYGIYECENYGYKTSSLSTLQCFG